MTTKRHETFQVVINLLLCVYGLVCVIPILLLFTASFSDNIGIMKGGYSFFPKQFSLDAYKYMYGQVWYILNAYGVTIAVTAIGTVVGLGMTMMLAYPLSRKDLPGHNGLSFFVFFTLLFNGGLVPTYLLYTQYLDIKNTIFGQIIPFLLMNGFNVLIARTFFMTSIPMAVIESARIDGAGEYRIFFKIVLPLSLPIMATIGLFEGIGYWNDWYNGLIFISNSQLFNIQNVLNQMLTNVQFLQSNVNIGSQKTLMQMPTESFRMALAVIGILPILIIYPFIQKYFIKGVAIGAVKG